MGNYLLTGSLSNYSVAVADSSFTLDVGGTIAGGFYANAAQGSTTFDNLGLVEAASGGAGRPEHFAQALRDGGASAVLAASLFHFGTLTVPSLKAFLASEGLPVRL